ncbi:hypothetical protein [Acidaminobacter sp. JC074]|uniref:hypothetical protein n=1 Tax=Acidaminobacter sp. JC074 TaxID=2530199 RepID=UPI001F0D59B1|nr:hypothetical protein [Acidaminobacter sp. JC074]
MAIGIIDADLLDGGTRHPNLALMKLSGYYKANGEDVELLRNYSSLEEYDVVYISKVFNFTKVPQHIYGVDNVVLGGTGFYEDGGESLADEIEHHMPDYSLYDDYIAVQVSKGKRESSYSDYKHYSIGFTSRGCFRKCEFCVNKKYDRAVRHSLVTEFLDEEKPYIYLWDDNFLAFSGWREVLAELNATGKPFQFRQGLDIRLMTKEKAYMLSNSKYHGDFIFAFDHIEDREIIEKKLKLWKHYTTKTTKLYVLCAYESQDVKDIENTFERIKILMKYGCLPYIMRYEDYLDSDYKSMYIQLARWCNQPNFFKKKSFRQFCEANQSYHKTSSTYCSAFQAMVDFETKHPDVAKKYFDIRFDELNEYDCSFGYGRKYAHKNDCEICKIEQKMWLDAFHGVTDRSLVLRDYLLQEMDLQCLIYGNGDCNEIECSKIADWFIEVLLSTPIAELVELISEHELEKILPSNIPQYSKLDDALYRTPDILGNVPESIRFEDLGFYLERVKKKEGAFKKYGENHSKLATLMDLAAITIDGRTNYIQLSVLGKSYLKISQEDKERLTARLMLRIPLVQHALIDAKKRECSLSDYLVILSEKTALRRSNNIADLFRHVKAHSDSDFEIVFDNILGV